MAVAGKGRFHWGKTLAVAQVLLSTVLLIVAGLFVRTLAQLDHQDLGFNRDRVITAVIDPLIAGFKVDQLPALYHSLQQKIEALPGVRSASLALYGSEGAQWSSWISIVGRTSKANEDLNARWLRVSPDFFSTLGIPVILGRTLGPEDMNAHRRVAVINQTMARRFFPGQNPVGAQFVFGNGFQGQSTGAEIRIIGVVVDAKYGGSPRDEIPPTIFLPFFSQTSNPSSSEDAADTRSNYAGFLAVRTNAEPLAVTKEIRQAVAQIDPNLPMANIATLNEQVEDSLSQEHLVSTLSACFGLLALVIAAVGLYGLMAYMTARRTGEIGLRMALGAESAEVLRMILRQGLGLALLGIGVGLACAYAAARWIASLLYGVSPGDPFTFGTAAALLLLVALSASYLPARRASRIAPMAALRYERPFTFSAFSADEILDCLDDDRRSSIGYAPSRKGSKC